MIAQPNSQIPPYQTGMGIAPIIVAAAIPVIAGGITKIATWLSQGCGNTCIEATQIVNQAEQVLAANQQAFFNGQIDKATALNTFDQVWLTVKQACAGIPGDAGTNCIADRQRGGKWDWFAMHRDPIADAPDNNVGSVTSMLTSTNVAGVPVSLIIGAGLIVAGLVVIK